MRTRLLAVIAAAVAAAAIAAAPAGAAALPGAHISATRYAPAASYPGMQHLHFEFGPVKVSPGQNNIDFAINDLKPDVPGYITRFKPNLVYADSHKVPRVDVIHLHHGVWLINGQPTFAAGEEKTTANFPQGYGLHSNPSDSWVMNHMIHNLTPNPTKVYITYDIDFVPDSAPAAAGITPAHIHWMDVAGIKAYPVFDAVRGMGRHGRYTFPTQARGAQRARIGQAQTWDVPRDITLIGASGHLHPGGLYNDLRVTRGTRTKHLFRAQAKYFEPAGAVSWDVSMTVTKPGYRVALHPGDRLSTTVTYDVAKASWYESMGIMVLLYTDGIQPGAKDPYNDKIDWHGILTHGHLKENEHHGGEALGLPDARDMLNGVSNTEVSIKNFIYGHGDLSLTGSKGRPPVVRAGRSLTFTNLDSTVAGNPATAIYHTITACRAPCNRTAGIAYPLANGKPGQNFDSGELGYGPAGRTAAANRDTWKTPKSLKPGTYTYFCRVHPFMRGSFRVITNRKTPKAAS